MSGSLAGAKLRTARALIAHSVSHQLPDAALGTITLRLDQRLTAARVRAQIGRDGGCLLANEVGTGKTYVALSIAREWRQPLIIVPASLRATWLEAMRRAGRSCPLVTHEALSRGGRVAEGFDGIIVDESHRFRGTARRHAALATLAARVPVLLLSATPLQNRLRELADQIALFVGERAYQLDEHLLARHVVRDLPAEDSGMPIVAPPRWLPVPVDDGALLRAILALPPPPRAADAGDGGALLVISLVRAWSSSRSALAATIRRRQRILTAIEQCQHEGRRPTTRELQSWQGDGDVQLGFASLLAGERIDPSGAAALGDAIASERVALQGLRDLMACHADPDVARAECLLNLRATHAGESILAFSERASTVQAYYRALRQQPGVGMLTARACRIASGRLSRQELLERFAPRAQGVKMPAAHDRVTLLLATDLLSEGVNLQDASVVVHLDLPWNPARLVQRLGRARRPHGAAEVFSYLIAPPAEASSLLRVDERLRAKLHAARRTIGVETDVLPAVSPWSARPPVLERSSIEWPAAEPPPRSMAEHLSESEVRLGRWRRSPASVRVRPGRCVVAAVTCDMRGWLAALDDGRLVASVGDPRSTAELSVCSVRDQPGVIAEALALAGGTPCVPDGDEARNARAMLDAHLQREWTALMCGALSAAGPHLREFESRIERTVTAVARHERSLALAIAAELRRAVRSSLTLGVERELVSHCRRVGRRGAHRTTDGLAGEPDRRVDPLRWLRVALHIVGTRSRGVMPDDSCIRPARPRPIAIILLTRDGAGSGEARDADG